MPRRIRGAVRWKWVLALGAMASLALVVSTQVCLSAGLRYGLWVRACPDGEFRQVIHLDAARLTRGAPGTITLWAEALSTDATGVHASTPISRFEPSVALVSATGETALTPKEGWHRSGDRASSEIELPKVNDGEYTLRARVASSVDTSTLELPLPLFTPARVHVITDRPLYEPGNTVKFRALALKAADLSPLEERPGVWRVTDPQGEVLLEEKAPSGPWGVVAGSFPIDLGAASGEWAVSWSSGATTEARHFTVKPFTLPRFRVEAAPVKPFYRPNERPTLKGKVKYASGAPVVGAKLELTWSTQGAWPPPTSWVEGSALPKAATTGPGGAFTVELPAVPDDLRGTATLSASIAAVDTANDRVEGSASILLSEDAISVSTVTELADGMVQGFNNRLYLRAMTADGRVLDGVTLDVKRLWEPSDPGTEAPVDEDGVASLQLDPGPPVNVVIPALPFRPPPASPRVTRESLDQRLNEAEVSLADRMVFDRLQAHLEACARYASGTDTVQVGLVVHASGAVGPMAVPSGKLGACVGRVLKELQLEAGQERLFDARWTFDDSDLPRFSVSLEGVPNVPAELEGVLTEALLEARDCLPATVRSGALPRLLLWRLDPTSRAVEVSWVHGKGDAFAETAVACVTSRVTALHLPKPDEGESSERATSVGAAHVSVEAPEKYEAERPQETVMVGYELLVTAKKGKTVIGSTRLRMAPGTVPAVRLRASQQLVDPGSTATVELLRGPDFTQELPEKLWLRHAYQSVEAKVDQETRSAHFSVPVDWEGWAAVEWNGASVFFFVRAKAPLDVQLAFEHAAYAPGQVAHLAVDTQVAGSPGPAAVGLLGVDESLAQLTTLPAPDELSKLRPQPAAGAPFGGIDAQALALGRVRGANAAAATLLRVSSLPPPPELEAAVAVNGQTTFDSNAVLVDRFYVVLGELANEVRRWETSAPPSEKMSPKTMASLWDAALAAVERRKESTRDAWGRRLRLHRLPADLLALTEPRALVINGTRLPEDVQNWAQWVAKEKP